MVTTRRNKKPPTEGGQDANEKDQSESEDEKNPILRVGDVIIYKPYPYTDGVVVGPAKITKIATNCFGELTAYTDWKRPTTQSLFRLVSSPHPDAPPISSKFTQFDSVLLEEGALEESAQEQELARRQSAESLPGGEAMMALAVACNKARRSQLPTDAGSSEGESKDSSESSSSDEEGGSIYGNDSSEDESDGGGEPLSKPINAARRTSRDRDPRCRTQAPPKKQPPPPKKQQSSIPPPKKNTEQPSKTRFHRYQSHLIANDALYASIENKLSTRTTAKGLSFTPEYLVKVLEQFVAEKDEILNLVKECGDDGAIKYAKLASIIPSHVTARDKYKAEVSARLTDFWRCIRENDIMIVSDSPALRSTPSRGSPDIVLRQLTAIMMRVEAVCRNELDDEQESDKVMKSAKISGESNVIHQYGFISRH